MNVLRPQCVGWFDFLVHLTRREALVDSNQCTSARFSFRLSGEPLIKRGVQDDYFRAGVVANRASGAHAPPSDHVCKQEENPMTMSKRFIATFLCSALSLIGASGFALAETIGRYECNYVGAMSQEAIGDREGHSLVSYQFSCFGVDGILKGAVYTASTASELDGTRRTYLFTAGIHRAPGGLAVTQLTEGTGSVIMKDGKPASSENTGKGLFKFASGTLAALSGKAFKFTAKLTGFNRFSLELTD
jgi:hypothetical protein